MEWVASTLHTTSEHGVSSITTADAHTSAASSRLNWRPRRFKWTRPFRWKTKCGFCPCAITFQLASTLFEVSVRPCWRYYVELTQCTGRVFLCLIITIWRRVGEWWYSSTHSKLFYLLINLSVNLYEHQNIYTFGVVKSPTCFATRRRCHHQGVFSIANVAPSNGPLHRNWVK